MKLNCCCNNNNFKKKKQWLLNSSLTTGAYNFFHKQIHKSNERKETDDSAVNIASTGVHVTEWGGGLQHMTDGLLLHSLLELHTAETLLSGEDETIVTTALALMRLGGWERWGGVIIC